MIILIDNYDSFSYNLFQLVGKLNPDIKVIRNDELTVAKILALKPTHAIISPGPGRPSEAGIIEEFVRTAADKAPTLPILGVCLGHQAICEAFGARITYAKQLMHGKKSSVRFNTKSPIFKGLSGSHEVARYHSLAADETDFPSCLKVTSRTDDNEIMAVEHEKLPIFGVQFHPESILTDCGEKMLANFLKIS